MRRALWIVLLAGCDSLADSGYVGEPMFTLTGTLNASDDSAGIALMWQDPTGAGGPGVAATTVPVELAFPSTFSVSIPLPPPDVARFVFDDDTELAEAYVFAVADPDAVRPSPRGLDRTHVLVFASRDVEAGTLAADYLGGPVSAGYHLRAFVPGDPTPAQTQMIERCAADATRDACAVRRHYTLGPIGDETHLRIVVAAP